MRPNKLMRSEPYIPSSNSQKPKTGPDHFFYSIKAAQYWKIRAKARHPMYVKLKDVGRPIKRSPVHMQNKEEWNVLKSIKMDRPKEKRYASGKRRIW